MMKRLPTIQSRAAFLLAAFLILSAASIRMTRAADASAPVAKSDNPRVVALHGADTAEAEFRVGASGKIAVMFEFAITVVLTAPRPTRRMPILPSADATGIPLFTGKNYIIQGS